MISFNVFFSLKELNIKVPSKSKTYQLFSSMILIDVGIILRDGPFESDIAILNLHPSTRTDWVAYINEKYFDSYDCVCPSKLNRYITKRKGYCLYSEYKIQGLDSYCAAYCLFVIYLTKVLGKDFKTAVLNLYYQTVS